MRGYDSTNRKERGIPFAEKMRGCASPNRKQTDIPFTEKMRRT